MIYYCTFLTPVKDGKKAILVSNEKGSAYLSYNGKDFAKDQPIELWQKKNIYKDAGPVRKHEMLCRTFRNHMKMSDMKKIKSDDEPKSLLEKLWKED